MTSENTKDMVVISRDSPKSKVIWEALRDYQGASKLDEGIVHSPIKYRETEGIKELLEVRTSSSPV